MKTSSDAQEKNYEWSNLSFSVWYGGFVIADEECALNQLKTISEKIYWLIKAWTYFQTF
jgi:hypothetical protein